MNNTTVENAIAPTSRHGESWTREEEVILLRMNHSGIAQETMAYVLGRSEGAVASTLMTLNTGRPHVGETRSPRRPRRF